jgi:hypothetical protein
MVIVGDGGTWRPANFEYPESNWTPKEPVDEIGSVDVAVGGKLWSDDNPCIPSCADATRVSLSWRFDGDHFVVTNPEAVKNLDQPKPAVPTTTSPAGPSGIDEPTIRQTGGRRQSDGYMLTEISWVASQEKQMLDISHSTGDPITVYPVPNTTFTLKLWLPYGFHGPVSVLNRCTAGQQPFVESMTDGNWCKAHE